MNPRNPQQFCDLPAEKKGRKRGRPPRILNPTSSVPTSSPSHEGETEIEPELDLSDHSSNDDLVPILRAAGMPSTPAGPTEPFDEQRGETEWTRKRAATSPLTPPDHFSSPSRDDSIAQQTMQLRAISTRALRAAAAPRKSSVDMDPQEVFDEQSGIRFRIQWLRQMQPMPGDEYEMKQIEIDSIPFLFDSSVRVYSARMR